MTTRMPWGKFRGTELGQVESGYLVWVYESSDATPALREAVREELATRFRPLDPPPPIGPRTPCPDTHLATALIAAGRRVLARQHHPDIGGQTATMQTVNAIADWLEEVLL